MNANPLQPGDPNNPMDTYDPLYDIDDVFPEDELGQELNNMGQGMDMGMDFMDFNFLENDGFDPQPGSPNAIQDRARQSSRTNEPSSVSSTLCFCCCCLPSGSLPFTSVICTLLQYEHHSEQSQADTHQQAVICN